MILVYRFIETENKQTIAMRFMIIKATSYVQRCIDKLETMVL